MADHHADPDASLVERLDISIARENELRRQLVNAHEQMLGLDRELECLRNELLAVYASRIWRYGSRLAQLKRTLTRRRP